MMQPLQKLNIFEMKRSNDESSEIRQSKYWEKYEYEQVRCQIAAIQCNPNIYTICYRIRYIVYTCGWLVHFIKTFLVNACIDIVLRCEGQCKFGLYYNHVANNRHHSDNMFPISALTRPTTLPF